MVATAVLNPWHSANKKDGTEGVRPILTARGQGNDVYRHVTFVAGAAATHPGLAAFFTAVDVIQAAMGRSESITEAIDDFAGWAVAAELTYGVMSGNTSRTQHLVSSTICSSGS